LFTHRETGHLTLVGHYASFRSAGPEPTSPQSVTFMGVVKKTEANFPGHFRTKIHLFILQSFYQYNHLI